MKNLKVTIKFIILNYYLVEPKKIDDEIIEFQ